ncbi:hypothetical protein ACIBJC_15175 [Streptomyces sp. NPDC050509]|uniref:hypothetical protein n=1 Tax=Streptomyces sp. NPDC050509 TaxID=3365620 RepID=UPI003790DBD2
MTDHFLRATTPASPLRTSALLRAIVQHLTAHRPDGRMTDGARLTVAVGTAGTATAARPVLRIMPWPARGITRGEYALHLRKAAWSAGCDARPASHTSGSDPDMDEALRRARRAPERRTFEDGDDVCPLCENWTCTCPRPTGATRTMAVAR